MAAKRNKYLDQAQLEAELQTSPQIAALGALLAGKRSDYIQTRRVNASNARGIAQAIREAVPEIQRTYGGDPNSPAQGSILASLLQGQGPEFAAARNRIVEEQGRHVADLTQQRVLAESARQYGNQQAREQYQGAKQEIQSTAQDLYGQQGKLAAAALNKLQEAARQRGVQRRGQDITAESQAANREISAARLGETTRHNKAMENKKTSKRPRRGLGSLTQQQESKILTQVGEARRWVKNLDAGLDQAQIGDALTTGQTLRDAAGNETKVPKLPEAVVSIAMDLELAERGRAISRRNIRRAHDELGIHIPRDWMKKTPAKTIAQVIGSLPLG